MKLFTLILLIFSFVQVHARPQYYQQLITKFPKVDQTTKCLTCHDGRGRNQFGQDFAANVLRNGNPLKFELIFNLDSDGDGRNNLQELNNGTNPGKRD